MATSAQIVKAAAERLSGAVVRRTIAKHTATVSELARQLGPWIGR